MNQHPMDRSPPVRKKPSKYGGICLHCRKEITAATAKQWTKAVRGACPHCGRKGW